MKKILIGIAAIFSFTLSSCSIFVHTKHHSAGVDVHTSSTDTPQNSTKTAGTPVQAGK